MKLRLPLLFLAFSCMMASVAGCSGRDIHPELKEDPHVLTRKSTLSTHGVFEPGDHGTEYSNPVVVDNTLVFGNRSVGLASIYPGINQQRWVLPIRNGVVSPLSVDHGAVYFGGGDGFFYSVNLENGRVNWRYEVRNPVISRPTVTGGRVFVTTSDDVVYAFDAGTGKWLWHYRRRSSPSATIYGASAPLVDGNDVLVGLSDGYLVSLGVSDGQLKWERKLHNGTKFTDVDAKPVLDNGIIYIPSYDGALYALKRINGEIVWRFDAGGSKSVALEGDRIYFPSTDGNIYALQKENEKQIWKFELDKGVPTDLIVTDKYIVVGSSFQYMYVIDKNSGKGVYRFNVGYDSGFSGSPAYDSATQHLFFLSGSGNLYSFLLTPGPKKIRPHGMKDPFTF